MATLKSLIKEIEKSRDKIAVERDRLRDTEERLLELMETTVDGVEELNIAIDTLSQYA